jgi:hypothetical protein
LAFATELPGLVSEAIGEPGVDDVTVGIAADDVAGHTHRRLSNDLCIRDKAAAVSP